MLNGSCCCKRVRFVITEMPKTMGTCHCTRCRKVGASTIIFVKKGTLEITQGRDFIKTYFPEEGYKYKRDFCGHCGSSLGEITSELESFPVPANLIDNNFDLEVSFEEFKEEKPSWVK